MTLRRLVPLLPATVLVFVTAVSASGAFERQHAPHVHGHAAGSLAQDGSLFSLSLDLPGVNLAGFERAPKDEDEQATLDNVMAHLESGRWLRFDPNGECRIEDTEVAAPGFAMKTDPTHHHDHEEAHEHAEFQIEVTFECDQADGLAWLDMDLFAAYPGNEQVRVDVLTDRRTGRVRLHPGEERIDLGATR